MGGSEYLPLIAAAIWWAALSDNLIERLPERFGSRAIATGLLAIAFCRWTGRHFEGTGPRWRKNQETTERVLATLKRFSYRPPHGKRIVFVGSPYSSSYDVVFMANLHWNDRTLEIEDANLSRKPQSDYDVVIEFRESGLEVVKQ